MGSQQGQAFEDLRNTISECSRIVRHRWRLAIVGLSVVGSVAFWCSQYLPREYTAATMFERRDDVVLQNLIRSNSPYGFEHLRTTMKLDMIGTRALAQAAVTIGMLQAETFTSEGALNDAEREALDGALAQYKLRPIVKLIHSSPSLDTILLRCDGNDPVVARKFVSAVRDNYISDTRDRIREILSGTKQFFAAEVKRLQEEMSKTEGTLREGFEEFPGLDPTDLVSVGNRLETLRVQQNECQQREAELKAQISAREQFILAVPELYADPEDESTSATSVGQPGHTASVDPILDAALEQVHRQIVELVTTKRMTMEHPEVKQLFRQREALEDLRATLLAAAAEQVPDAVPAPVVSTTSSKAYRDWKTQQMRVELELDSLRRQHEVATKRLEASNERVGCFAALYERLIDEGDDLRRLREKRTEGAAEIAIWQGHLARLDRVLTAESGQRGTQFTLIEEPKDISRPTKPRIASVFVVCSGLGLAAAALLVALAELFDRSFRSVNQVTRLLGVPVLECISVIPTPRERRRAMLSRVVWTPALAVLVLSLVTTAALAYTSVARPDLHARAMQRVDGVLDLVGAESVLPPSDRST